MGDRGERRCSRYIAGGGGGGGGCGRCSGGGREEVGRGKVDEGEAGCGGGRGRGGGCRREIGDAMPVESLFPSRPCECQFT